VTRDTAREAFYGALLDDDPVALYERAPCGYLSTTPDGRIVKVNETLLTWTGYAREDLVGSRSFVDLLSVGGRLYHETHYAPMLRMQSSVREIAVEVVRRDGSRLPVLVNASLERDPEGAPRVVRIALFDATERREYERELLRAKERAEESEERARRLARTLQQTLVPPLAPTIPGLDVAAAFRPAGDGSVLGGDFYDVFAIGESSWVVALGDVCGKGPEAAAVTALVRYALRAVAVEQRPPHETLRIVNDVLMGHETDRFCSVALVRLTSGEGRWHVEAGSAGHPPALLARRGAAPTAFAVDGPLLGLFDGADFDHRRAVLEPGDVLVLFTDGVTEGRRDKDFFGDARLAACLEAHPASAAEACEALLGEVVEFQRGTTADDIAIVVIRVPDVDPRMSPAPADSTADTGVESRP
jgi:sigma-B regulation protein RsbU (phosphoserine phosphatase)